MRAVVFILHDERVSYQPFDGPDCLNRAHDFRRSVESDFPGALMSVTGDDEATEDRTARLFAAMGWGRPEVSA